jgi:hypothetical protein
MLSSKLRKFLLERILLDKDENPVRPIYKSPKERDNYNYGYMESSEFGANIEKGLDDENNF